MHLSKLTTTKYIATFALRSRAHAAMLRMLQFQEIIYCMRELEYVGVDEARTSPQHAVESLLCFFAH